MAQGSNYKVPFRRRREGKTDYAARMKLVDYDKSRLVVRLSNAHATVQVIDYAPEGDITLASAVSKQLANYGYLGGASNTSAVYLTGYLCAKRALAKGVDSAILDIGLKSAIRGSKVFAALKGAVDAGFHPAHTIFWPLLHQRVHRRPILALQLEEGRWTKHAAKPGEA